MVRLRVSDAAATHTHQHARNNARIDGESPSANEILRLVSGGPYGCYLVIVTTTNALSLERIEKIPGARRHMSPAALRVTG